MKTIAFTDEELNSLRQMLWAAENEYGTAEGVHKAAFDKIKAAIDGQSDVSLPDLLKEAAEIAGREWTTFSQAKEAHERHSPEPFRFRDFGLDYDKALYSKDCMERILALGSRDNSPEGHK